MLLFHLVEESFSRSLTVHVCVSLVNVWIVFTAFSEFCLFVRIYSLLAPFLSQKNQ